MQVDKAQYERVLSFIDRGKREGATLLTGGKPCGKKGYYIEPTIFTNVKVQTKLQVYNNFTSENTEMPCFTV